MATPVFHSGFFGTAAISGTELSVTQWDVGGMSTIVKFKNSVSGTIPIYDSTFQEYPVSMQIDVDFANDIFGSPLNLRPGLTVSNANFYQHQSAKSALDGPHWSFPSLILEKIGNPLVVDGKTTYQVSGYGFGAFTTP